MRSSSKFAVLCTLIVCSYATPIFEPIFVSFSEDPQPETKIIKRDVAQENTDGTLKQVSLQSLIGGLENSLVRSALSVSSIMQNKGAGLVEVIPPSAEENHANKKRHTEQTESTEAYHQVTSTEIPTVGTKGLLLQTTEQVPSKEGSPAHILIDRVTVQDFSGDFPLILPFEVKHTKVISATISSGNSTEISITKTSTTSTSTLVGSSTENPATISSTTGSSTQHPTVAATGSTSTTEAKTNGDISSSLQTNTETTASDLRKTTDINSSSSTTTTAETTTTSTTSSTTTTTKTPTIKLKEAEQELKEKVAEIEADPVILSSRI